MTYHFRFEDETYNFIATTNQKIIQIHKYKGLNGVNFEAEEEAQMNLSHNAFQIYCYLRRHQDKWVWSLYAEHTMKVCKLGKSSYHEAVKELIANKYLVNGKINELVEPADIKSCYHFYESPRMVATITPDGRRTY